jgi:choice-of-anchor A domain-containing protein
VSLISRLTPPLLFAFGATCSLAAHAAPISLGAAGSYNVLAFGDFTATNSDVEGAVAVGGDLTAVNYSINSRLHAAGNTALVVGGDLDLRGQINGGEVWVGGSTANGATLHNAQAVGGASPVDFAALQSELQALSLSLSQTAATGTFVQQYGGLVLTAQHQAIEYFSLDALDLLVNYGSIVDAAAGATIIMNVSGSSVALSQNFPAALKGFNVLYNFYEATTLNLQGIEIHGSILAPYATLTGGSGQINGNVVVANWDAQIEAHSNGYFQPVGGDMPRIPDVEVEVGEVPEPATLALLAIGAVALRASRRRAAR